MPMIAKCMDCGAERIHDGFTKAYWAWVWDHIGNKMECRCNECAGVVVKEKKARKLQ